MRVYNIWLAAPPMANFPKSQRRDKTGRNGPPRIAIKRHASSSLSEKMPKAK